MNRRRIPWIELACLALIGIAWAFARFGPSQPYVRTSPAAESPAAVRTLSIHGIHLDMSKETAEALLASRSAGQLNESGHRTWVHHGEGGVHMIMGSQLEKNGGIVLREGDKLSSMEKVLGPPRNRDYYGAVYVVENSVLRIHLRSDRSYQPDRPEASEPVIWGFQLKRI
jgi:hypothetical protein